MAKKEPGFEIVPLHPFTPSGCHRNGTGGWDGGEYLSGPLSADHGLTLPGRPIRVRTKVYAESLVEARLACYAQDMTLGRLSETYREAFDNRARWGDAVSAVGQTAAQTAAKPA